MKRLVKFTTSSGQEIMVEVDDSIEGMIPVGRGEDLFNAAYRRFDTALDSVHAAAEDIVMRLKNLSERPDKIEVEFGIKLSAEAGAVVASSALEANYVVKLTWGE